MRKLSQIPRLRRGGYDSGFVILLAPDSFKGSCSATEACNAMAEGILSVCPETRIISLPLSDGGEGCMGVLLNATGGERCRISVKNPLMRPIEAEYGILSNRQTAVMDMASASGLILLKHREQNPMRTTTYGTGEMIKNALGNGVKKIIIGIGGSATTDGGVGAAQALGCRFLDKNNRLLRNGLPGGELNKIHKIDVSKINPLIKKTRIIVACDVDNPFTGARGAAHVYSPQKGASPDEVEKLERNLCHLAGIVKRDLLFDLNSIKGSGAAGGLGGGLCAFLGAGLKKGIDVILKTTGFPDKLKGVDLILTGEGCMDIQTMNGKTVWGVVREAGKAKIPVIALVGSKKKGYEALFSMGLTSAFSITPEPVKMEKAIKDTLINLQDTSANIMRILINGRRIFN